MIQFQQLSDTADAAVHHSDSNSISNGGTKDVSHTADADADAQDLDAVPVVFHESGIDSDSEDDLSPVRVFSSNCPHDAIATDSAATISLLLGYKLPERNAHIPIVQFVNYKDLVQCVASFMYHNEIALLSSTCFSLSFLPWRIRFEDCEHHKVKSTSFLSALKVYETVHAKYFRGTHCQNPKQNGSRAHTLASLWHLQIARFYDMNVPRFRLFLKTFFHFHSIRSFAFVHNLDFKANDFIDCKDLPRNLVSLEFHRTYSIALTNLENLPQTLQILKSLNYTNAIQFSLPPYLRIFTVNNYLFAFTNELSHLNHLTELDFSHNMRYPDIAFTPVLPSSLRKLVLYPSFNSKFICGILPDGLIELDFVSDYDHLSRFNQPLQYLPKSLQILKLSHDFNQPILPGNLPENLTLLRFPISSRFDQPLYPGGFPASLKFLYFGWNYNPIQIDLSILPVNLKVLWFPHGSVRYWDNFHFPAIHTLFITMSVNATLLTRWFNNSKQFRKSLKKVYLAQDFLPLIAQSWVKKFTKTFEDALPNIKFIPIQWTKADLESRINIQRQAQDDAQAEADMEAEAEPATVEPQEKEIVDL